jgi:hypothetical protein
MASSISVWISVAKDLQRFLCTSGFSNFNHRSCRAIRPTPSSYLLKPTKLQLYQDFPRIFPGFPPDFPRIFRFTGFSPDFPISTEIMYSNQTHSQLIFTQTCKTVISGFSPDFPPDFPRIFPGFSPDFPRISPDFPRTFPGFSPDFPRISPRVSPDFLRIIHGFSPDFFRIFRFPRFSPDFPRIFPGFSYFNRDHVEQSDPLSVRVC